MNIMYRMLLATVALAFSSVAASAETITGCASGCDYTSINAAIDAANDGDVIQLAAETYCEGEQIDPLGKAITLRGVLNRAGEPASVLNGAGAHRVLICQSGETGTTVFERLVIQSGRGENEDLFGTPRRIGGGLYNDFSSPTLTNCTFTECCQVHPPRSFIDLGGNDYDSWCDDCRADVNCRDDAVNAADLGILIGSWGTVDPQCDLNDDGTVDAADLGLLIGAWGPCR